MDTKKEGPILRTARLTNPLNSDAKLQFGGGSGNIIFRYLPPKTRFFPVESKPSINRIILLYLIVYQHTNQFIKSRFGH